MSGPNPPAPGDAVRASGLRPARRPPPVRVRAEGGTGHVLLDWEPVEGALGYLVHRAASPDGPFEPVDHGGGDVLAVPAAPYADTTLPPGEPAWYAVATWTEAGPGPLSVPRRAAAGSGPSGRVTVEVAAARPDGTLRPVWRMVGSEHLSLLGAAADGDWPGGADVAAELAEALRIARDELGCRLVRAHGAFLPEMVAVRPGAPPDFSGLDAVYDRLLGLGLRPVVELSFMPPALAADPDATVFTYRAVISPPADWAAWGRLCGDLAAHLVERYGIDEVAGWAFEVWNEANLEVFWTGTQAEYFRLYDEAARAVKAVDRRLRVGGPGSAAAGWVGDLLAHAHQAGSPVDFVSTHTYGNLPLDLRPLTRAWADGPSPDGRVPPQIWWTEWGVTPTHFAPVNDAVFGAPFVLSGVKAAMASADALAYWVVSDHFEELGRPPRLFHGGFGLLTVGNLRKPRFRALELLGRLGPQRLAVGVSGDGAGGLVDALATRDRDGTVAVLAWNGTLNQGKVDGDPLLDRAVTVRVAGLPAGSWRRSVHRVDAAHGNLLTVWRDLGAPAWPDERAWRVLRAADRLDPAEPPRDLSAPAGSLEVDLDLPMPGVALVCLTPAGSR
jgi:xylan 1,4-beta-xylosidase